MNGKVQLPVGKSNPDILGRFIARYTDGDNRIIIGPGVGEDATIFLHQALSRSPYRQPLPRS